MSVYYNENDPKAAAWLRMLIQERVIPEGVVDERSIHDVRPSDLAGYTQCHFFAGIGGWAEALRLANWGDQPVWTGSCPCQPFSAAGKGLGQNDPRHLWPIWFELIRQCRPLVIFGEQVASRAALSWLDTVQDDMESEVYSLWAVDLCAAGVGAPHIRQRLYWVAEPNGGHTSPEWQQRGGEHGQQSQDGGVDRLADAKPQHDRPRISGEGGRIELANSAAVGALGHPSGARQSRGVLGNQAGEERAAPVGGEELRQGCGRDDAPHAGPSRRLGDPDNEGPQGRGLSGADTSGNSADQFIARPSGPDGRFWEYCEWLHCTDGKSRPVEPGSFPLAYGIPGRVGLLRGYGNAIIPEAAAEFVRAYKEIAIGRRT